MSDEKYSALWVSYSSINTFLSCPRAYFLSSVYKDPSNNRKMSIITPSLALGQIVHEVVESLSIVPVKERFDKPLYERFEKLWKKVTGKKGGFRSAKQEERFKDRGRDMLSRVIDHPGPLERLAVKIRQELPNYWLSEDDEIILCGKIDWLEYLPDNDSVHIIDFKTGVNKVESGSLQLPIYLLLAQNTQKRPVVKSSYWHLEHDDEPIEVPLTNTDDVKDEVLRIAKKIKLARKLDKLACPSDGCKYCQPYELILQEKATLVGMNDFGQDLYVVGSAAELESDIL